MQIKAPVARGSMGIPPEMTAEFERRRAEAQKGQEPPAAMPMASDEGFDPPSRVDDPEKDPDQDEKSDVATPEQLLKKIGVELTDDDLHKSVFKGFVEKDIAVKFFGGKITLVATMKTMTAAEYDAAAELLGEELNDSTILKEDVAIRRDMWSLAMGLSKLAGKPLVKPVMEEVEQGGKTVQRVDLKATAKAKRVAIAELAGSTVATLIGYYIRFSSAIHSMSQDEGSAILKK